MSFGICTTEGGIGNKVLQCFIRFVSALLLNRIEPGSQDIERPLFEE